MPVTQKPRYFYLMYPKHFLRVFFYSTVVKKVTLLTNLPINSREKMSRLIKKFSNVPFLKRQLVPFSEMERSIWERKDFIYNTIRFRLAMKTIFLVMKYDISLHFENVVWLSQRGSVTSTLNENCVCISRNHLQE